MKKNIVIVFAVVVFMFVSCNSKKQGNTENNHNEAISGQVVKLTTEAFKQKVYNFEANKEWKFVGDKPAIIDFYATWCVPCKQVAPIMEGLAKEYDGKIVIYKIDVDSEQLLAQNFGIQSIPSILFIPVKGRPQMMQGAAPKESFVKAINEILLKD